MRRTSSVTVSALVLTAALALTGCSAGSADPEPSGSDSSATSSRGSAEAQTLDATPASGAVIEGDGYSYAVPEGWAQQDSSVAPGTDTVALDAAATGNFATNVNVLLSPAGLITPADVEALAADELEGSGATDVELLDRVIVAGSESAHVTAVLSADEVSYRVHQYYVSNEEQTYVVTFSSSEELVTDDEAVAIAESVLASWAWS
jgi:hypothetical protein